jgi:hypothetical protein
LILSFYCLNIYNKKITKVANDVSLNLNLLNSRIIDGSNSQTQDQLYFVGTGNNYVKKVDSSTSIQVKQSGNFYQNTNPVGSKFSDILDGGDSSRSEQQFLAPIVGGVDPVNKNGI